MKLYLVQHGEACAEDIDPERPLTVQGRADVERLSALMKQAGIHVERVMHSGKLRARQTAELLAKAMAPDVEAEISGLLNPNDNPSAFDWQSESWDRDTLIVGHLPFMSRLVSHLLIENADRALVSFQPGSIACLEHNGAEGWILNWMIRPELVQP
jgi:phosphohistidine phosphatase